MKPRILISGSKASRKNYEKAVLAAGGEPHSFYLPEVSLDYDGLILGGGGDIEPALYGQKSTAAQSIDHARDTVEWALTQAYLKEGKPILGICRGHQVVNAVLGGALSQDLGRKLCLFHGQDNAGCDRIHPVLAVYATALHRLYGDVFSVNSAHHQSVCQPGKGMIVSAVSECGLIEATEHLTLPVLTVQWHPERMAEGAPLFAWLMEKAGISS